MLVSNARALRSFVVAAAVVVSLPVCAALPQRTFVRSDGSDSNPCSLASPCRGFAAAVAAVAAGGEVIVLDSAGYGSATITKSVSLISPAGIYAGISVPSGSDGITVNAGGGIVVLRGLSINGQGGTHGVRLQAAGRLRIENCVISGLAGDGVHHTAADAELIVLDTIIRDNGGSGVWASASGSIDLHHVRSEHNAADGFQVAPAFGTLGITVTVSDSVFTHNVGRGIFAEITQGATTTISVERSVMAGSGGDGFKLEAGIGSAKASVSRSLVNDNGGNGILVEGSGGQTNAVVTENVFKRNSIHGLHVTATGANFAIVEAALNAGSDSWSCQGEAGMTLAALRTFKNNFVPSSVLTAFCPLIQSDGI